MHGICYTLRLPNPWLRSRSFFESIAIAQLSESITVAQLSKSIVIAHLSGLESLGKQCFGHTVLHRLSLYSRGSFILYI
jgi:hypothetical protein